ncbi:hypothetical protein O181_037623 [Austropuccinia psidii MF-1]|uniref:Uncharacterized protein n=1 Tax=Austropuccinia psidii MF-1 TaxID=1389203 RepID=A0A9Q3DBS5_9BASI|nr:hypothetical protein [Austropuccinia psidii MF-1]
MAFLGHLGPRPSHEKGLTKDEGYGLGAQNPPGDKRTPPGPKPKIEAWGLEIWKLARKANNRRRWPKAISDHWGHEGPGEISMAKGP